MCAIKMTQRVYDHHQHHQADGTEELLAAQTPSSRHVTIDASEGAQFRGGGGGHKARQQFSNTLFQRQREQHQRRWRRGSRCIRQSSELSTATSSSHQNGHPTAVAARLAMLSVGDQSDSGKSASPRKGRNYRVRQSSEPTLTSTAMAMPPGVSRDSNSASNAVASTTIRGHLIDSTASDCTENSNSRTNSRQSSASSLSSLWGERRDCRQKQVGPNPFAFF